MTRVIVAPESFKESLASSPEVADAITRGVGGYCPRRKYSPVRWLTAGKA